MEKTVDPSSLSEATPAPNGQAVYDELLPVALALRPAKVRHINLEITHVATTCIAVADGMRPHLARLVQVPGFEATDLDALANAGIALLVAEADHRVAVAAPQAIGCVVDQAVALRRRFYKWGKVLADAGRVAPDAVRSAPGRGHVLLATDLFAWVRLFRQTDTAIHGAAWPTAREYAEAERLAEALLAAHGARAATRRQIAVAADRRARFFTLAVERYEHVRRIVLFLRWDLLDADRLAPSLFRKHGRTSEQDRPVDDSIVSDSRDTTHSRGSR